MPKPLILWVDDDLDDLEVFSQAAGEVSLETTLVPAHNGVEALQYLAEAKKAGRLPDLIVLDMNMPKLDGRETLVSLKHNPDYKAIRAIVFTTSSSPLDQTFCERLGVTMFTKPQTYEGLKDLIKSFIGTCKKGG